mgnify:CR=1 FL=1
MRPIGDASNPFGSGQSFVMVCGFTSGVVSHKEPSVPSSYPQNVKEPRLAPLSRCCHQSEPLERLTALYPDSIRYVKRNVSECAYSVRYHTEMDRRKRRASCVCRWPGEELTFPAEPGGWGEGGPLPFKGGCLLTLGNFFPPNNCQHFSGPDGSGGWSFVGSATYTTV